MKLYFMPGACSLAVHIALREAALPFSLIEVDYRTRRTLRGRDFLEINSKGYVPVLVLDDGRVLTEVPVILQVVDALAPAAALLPVSGMKRFEALEWLNFIATEIHKSFSPLFRPTTPKAFLKPGRAHLSRRLDVVERHLRGHRYLTGQQVTMADFYLFVVGRWLGDQEMSIADWPKLQRHFDAISKRPAVAETLAAEGLTEQAEHREDD